MLVEYPRLMQRPVLVIGDRAIIGRPKDRVAEFLANPATGLSSNGAPAHNG